VVTGSTSWWQPGQNVWSRPDVNLSWQAGQTTGRRLMNFMLPDYRSISGFYEFGLRATTNFV
jgi:hypothetical protein